MSIEELEVEIIDAAEKIETAINTPPPALEVKRQQLLKLAEDGEIDKSVAYVKKANKNIVEKLFAEYERKRAQRANEFLTDLLISKFASALGGFDAIDDPEALEKELNKDELLKKDVHRVVESITPYIPCLGILSGGVTTMQHVYKHKTDEGT